jgi:hypothetical protein
MKPYGIAIWYIVNLCFPIVAFSQIRFVENAEPCGIDFVQTNGSRQKDYIVEAKGAGVAVADINGDGWDDIYFVNGAYLHATVDANSPRNQLYLNQGDGTFKNGTIESGLGDPGFGVGAYFADVDNDGDLDCYLTNYGPNQLYRNDGAGRFEMIPNAGGAQNEGWSTGAAFADIDGDGYLDLYVGQYAVFSPEIADRKGKYAPYFGTMSFIGPSAFPPAEDNLFLNNGDGTFRDVTKERGINGFECGRAFTVHFTDIDSDGDFDIYIANDTTANHLYENMGNGFFEDISLLAGVALSDNGKEQGGMGVAIKDVDGDLDPDIAVANYQNEYNILYRNDGRLQFTDNSYKSGVSQGTVEKVSFGMIVEDFDNDAWPDMFVSAGHVYPVADQLPMLHGYAQKNLFFRNRGKGIFDNRSNEIGPASDLAGVSRGCAAADFDHDGDLDIVVNNLDGAPFFLENQSHTGNWLQIAIQNEEGMPAFGSRVVVTTGERTQMAELYSSGSFLSQNSAVLHFGLADATLVENVRIRRPDGVWKEWSRLPINRKIVIRKNVMDNGKSNGQ